MLTRLKATIESELELDEPPQTTRALDQAQIAALAPAPVLRARLLSKAASMTDSDLARFAYEHVKEGGGRAAMFMPAPIKTGAPHRPSPMSPGKPTDDLFAAAAAWDPMELPGTSVPIRDISTRKLASGLTVIVAKRQATAAVAWLGFRGGYADADPPLLVALALRTRPDAVDPSKGHVLTGRGATRDASIETIEFRPVQLRNALSLLFLKATARVRTWPAQDGLERLLAPIATDQDPASLKASAAFQRALFGDHPLARVVDKADLDKVTRSDVEAWVSR
ncbi:MAG: hypothetical protein ACRDL8_22355, partial [Solirubrobacteraceae bacterium]